MSYCSKEMMLSTETVSNTIKYLTPTFQSNVFVWNINDFRNNRKYSSNFFPFCGYCCYLYLEASDSSVLENYTTFVTLGIQGFPAPYKRSISCQYSIILKNDEGEVCAFEIGKIEEEKSSFRVVFYTGQLKSKIHSKKFPSMCFSWCEDIVLEASSQSVQTEPECYTKVLKNVVQMPAAETQANDMCTTEEKEAHKLLVNLSRDFESFFESKTDTDCVLKVGEKCFPVHRFVLSVRSKVFAAMFHHNTSESRSGTVDILDVEADVLGDVLYFMYTGKIRGLSTDTAASMYSIADKYALIDLRQACLNFLMHNLTVENVCEVALLAHKHADTELASKAMHFIKERLK